MSIADHGSVSNGTIAAPVIATTGPDAGPIFLTATARSERARALADAGFVIARVALEAGHRGQLSETIAGAVELSLALRGALPPGVEIDASSERLADDQLFRARKLGARGLALVLSDLAPIAEDGVLHSDDGACLAAWSRRANQLPVAVLLSEDDRDMGMLAPQPLDVALGVPRRQPSWAEDARDRTSVIDPDQELERLSAVFDDDDDLPVSTHQSWHLDAHDDEDADAIEETRPSAIDASTIDRSAGDDAGDDDWDAPSLGALLGRETQVPLPIGDHDEDDRLAGFDEDDDFDDDFEDDDDDHEDEDDADEDVEPAPAKPTRARRVMERDPLQGIEADLGAAPPLAADPQPSLFNNLPEATRSLTQPPPPPLSEQETLKLVSALEKADGPRPVREIERLFREVYTPLLSALSSGLADRRAAAAVDTWSRDFEHSYSESFANMRVTGRRPTMVLDAPEVASRIGRAHGARLVQLLLVDGMRYDLGLRVREQLSERMAERAVCVEEPLLWSALPTVTPQQMHLLSRGARGLSDDGPQSERDAVIHREGSVTTLRRVRIGPRDLVKLDVAEARLREAGPAYAQRFDQLADEIASVIASFSDSLQPRTLLFVFGDHGFHLPLESLSSTGPAEQGGATPEEVLVGAQAWLVGNVH